MKLTSTDASKLRKILLDSAQREGYGKQYTNANKDTWPPGLETILKLHKRLAAENLYPSNARVTELNTLIFMWQESELNNDNRSRYIARLRLDDPNDDPEILRKLCEFLTDSLSQ